MSNPAHALLMRQFLAGLAQAPKPYAIVLEGWRSSCPRLSVWEDALEAGLVRILPGDGPMAEARVALTPAGRAMLAEVVPA